MRILITSGGTREYVDDVRVLTNISTGKLGAEIATKALIRGNLVVYVRSSTAARPAWIWRTWGKLVGRYIEVVASSTEEVRKALLEWVPNVDAVVMTMAISDFTFDRSVPVKLKSNDPEAFIESMRARIRLNPKLISGIKQWNPNAILVGFKFEVGLTFEQLIAVARESMGRNKADIVVANDKEQMKREGQHVAYLIHSSGIATASGKQNIAKAVLLQIELAKHKVSW